MELDALGVGCGARKSAIGMLAFADNMLKCVAGNKEIY